MNASEARKKLAEASALLSGSSTTQGKIRTLRGLVKGIRPELDQALEALEREFPTLQRFMHGDVVTLAADQLPETTEEEKKRKKALLGFINLWKKLKSEVSRIEGELAAANTTDDKTQKQAHWANIVKHAAGPVGLITLVALGIALLQTSAVSMIIENDGCGTLEASNSLPFPVPGFALPAGPIESGGSGTMTIPPLTLTVDGTKSGALTVKAVAFTVTFELPNTVRSVTLDMVSLIGGTHVIPLSNTKEHHLTLSCKA